MTVLLALAASVFLGTADFLGGTLARKVPLLTVLVLSQIVGTLAVLPRIMVDPLVGDLGPALAWGALGGIGVAVGVASLYEALARGTMGVVAPLASLSVLVPVIAGVLGGDRLSALLVTGMVVAVLGTMLASGPEVGRSPKPVWLALLSAAGFGFSNLTVAWGSAHQVSGTLLANAVVALVIYLGFAMFRRQIPTANGWPLAGIIAIGLLGFAANLSFALASREGMLSVVAVFASLFPVVTVVLGRLVHAERLSRLQLLGVVLVFAGVGVIAANS